MGAPHRRRTRTEDTPRPFVRPNFAAVCSFPCHATGEATMLSFGVTVLPDPPYQRMIELRQIAEGHGFEYAWTYDSHILWEESYATLPLAAAQTSKIKLGHFVTNPGIRDPTITASWYATMQDISDGRMVMGIGRGDSSRRVVGLKPVRVAEFESRCAMIKDLMNGRSVDWNEKELELKWVREELPDIADARDQSRWFPAMVSNHVMDLIERYGEDSEIPKDLTDFVKARKFYDYKDHSRVGAAHGEFVTDEIVDRFCVLGTVAEATKKLKELESIGVDQFNIYLMTHGQEETLRAYGDEIIPQFTSVAA